MISTVTGDSIAPEILRTPQYWAENLISLVRFSEAGLKLVASGSGSHATVSDVVEIGPHCALKRPLQDTIAQAGLKKPFRIHSVLNKTKSSLQSTLDLVGRLFCNGHPVSIPAVNQDSHSKTHPSFFSNLPRYPFNHSRGYWAESRLSRDYRLRGLSPGCLGVRSHDWSPLQPRWRKYLSLGNMPWVSDHVVS